MHDGAGAWQRFGSFDPFVLGPAWIDDKVPIIDTPFGRYGELFFHPHDLIGLGNPPTFGPLPGGRKIGVVALGAAVIDPREQEFPLVVRQTRVILEMSVFWIG